LYHVDVEARSATLAASEFQTGQFASFSRSNQITVLPDAGSALFTVPDGITANTVSVMRVNLEDLSTSVLVDQQAVYPTLNQGANAFPLTSPDGRWLALVTTSPNNENTLRIFDLNDLSVAPISISAGSQNDIIADMAFSDDSQRLIFIAGSESTGRTADNSLIAVDLSTGSEFRIKRGRFARGLAVAPDGSAVVAMDAQVLEDERQPPWLDTILVNVDTSETVTLFTGADIVEGEVTNQRFAKPLSWR
jgi:Tol biopolymer transport system component